MYCQQIMNTKNTSKSDFGNCVNGEANQTNPTTMDYDPVNFLRCHSKKNDSSDISTQVWQCAFEPDVTDSKKTTSLVATCGGNSVCFIDVEKGKVILKYYAKDLREMFYALAWTTQGKDSFLVTGGVRYTVHFIHPASGLAFHLGVVRSTKHKNHINSLMFHPQHWNLLLCGGSHGEIHICHIGNPTPPELDVDFVVMQSFSTDSEVFSMTFCAANNMLLTGCEDGLKGFTFPPVVDGTTKPIQGINLRKFALPTDNKDDNQDLVDSVEAIGDGMIATKCATRGTIYLWSLTDTLARDDTYHVRPSHLLRWSSTDNYFMFIGIQSEAQLLCCGDDKGSLWLYDMSKLPSAKPDSPTEVEPDAILPWPQLTDPYTAKKRKLSVDTYDIVVAKVSLASNRNHIVAVTNNNMVCVWERVQS